MPQSWDGKGYDTSSDPSAALGRRRRAACARGYGGLVIDAGCGSGRVTEQLLERLPRAQVLAFDASASMIAAAGNRLARYGSRVTLRVHDLGTPLETPAQASADGALARPQRGRKPRIPLLVLAVVRDRLPSSPWMLRSRPGNYAIVRNTRDAEHKRIALGNRATRVARRRERLRGTVDGTCGRAQSDRSDDNRRKVHRRSMPTH
jgi:SAM-dependent methyltransferase